MSDQFIANLALAAMLAMGASLCAGFLINAIRTQRGPRAIVITGVCFCITLDLLLTFVNSLPRP